MLEPIVTSIRHCAASWGCLLAMYSSSTALITLSLMAADRESLSGFSNSLLSSLSQVGLLGGQQ